MTDQIIRVGLAVIVLNEKGQILIGKRIGKHGNNTWAIPGGHLEFGESFEECARREIKEETGMNLESIQVLKAKNYLFESEGRHSVAIYVIGKVSDQKPLLTEPDKTESWIYVDSMADIPHPQFVPYVADVESNLIELYKEKYL